MGASIMKKITLLREYLRTRRRVTMSPSMEGLKKLEYLCFVGADACPDCGEAINMVAYVCTKEGLGRLFERYRCPSCGAEFLFSLENIH